MVGVQRHERVAVGPRPGEQDGPQPYQLRVQFPEPLAQPQRGRRGLEVVARTAGVQPPTDPGAEGGDEVILVGEVQPARGRYAAQRGVLRRPKPFDVP